MATRSSRTSGSRQIRKKVSAAKRRTAKPARAKARSRAAARPAARAVAESPQALRARAERILEALKKSYPGATTALNHRNAYELLVATVLSAQCTDERVNQVTPELFRRYPDPAALAQADQAELEDLIRSTGFYRNKARNLLGIARQICSRFGGQVPDRMDDLVSLPGVARKTANCVLGTWFGRNEGIVVDTHVGRVALRLGLSRTARNAKDAGRIEQDLMALLPRESWTFASHALIWHGRKVCTARKPACAACALSADCPSAGKV
jgi:endonuclease-3